MSLGRGCGLGQGLRVYVYGYGWVDGYEYRGYVYMGVSGWLGVTVSGCGLGQGLRVYGYEWLAMGADGSL